MRGVIQVIGYNSQDIMSNIALSDPTPVASHLSITILMPKIG